MRLSALTHVVLVVVAVTSHADETLIEYENVEGQSTANADAEAVERWRDRRFGMFIHWGPSADRNLPHSHARRSRFKTSGTVEPEVYDRFYETFNPTKYDPQAWMDLAKQSGMRYVVFTAKHHDGFSMFDSAVTDYDIMSTPYKKDVCKMLADACHDKGLALGWYYSPRDWYHPDFDTERHEKYNQFYEAQMQELASNYGALDVVWFDGTGPVGTAQWGETPLRVAKMLREKHPQIMLNPRGGVPGDFETTEKRVGPFNRELPWETCVTTTYYGWVYRNEEMETRPFEELLNELISSAGNDGNYLLNIGPRADGTIDPRHAERLLEIGSWLEENGEAIYGTRGGPFTAAPWGASTCKEKTIYLLVTDPQVTELTLPSLEGKIVSSRMLNGGQANVVQDDSGIHVTLAKDQLSKGATVVVIELDRTALDLPILPGQPSLTLNKTAKVSSVMNGDDEKYGPANAIDGDQHTYWEADQGNKECWIEIDLGKEEWVGHAILGQLATWCPLSRFELQYKSEDDWVRVLELKGKSAGSPPVLSFTPFRARHVRLNITKYAVRLNLCNFQLYKPNVIPTD